MQGACVVAAPIAPLPAAAFGRKTGAAPAEKTVCEKKTENLEARVAERESRLASVTGQLLRTRTPKNHRDKVVFSKTRVADGLMGKGIIGDTGSGITIRIQVMP